MDLTVILALCTLAIFGKLFMQHRRGTNRELARLRGEEVSFVKDVSESLNAAAASIADRKTGKNTIGYHLKEKKDALDRKLKDAGLESSEARGKFLLARLICAVLFPLVGFAIGFSYMIPYYATLFTIFMSGFGIAGPILWLRTKAGGRLEEIQRELPLVLDLTNLGTSAGWDVSSALERVIDALYLEFPGHPLIKELKKARWLIPSGATWEDALKRVSEKLGDDTVRRTTLALGQAIKQGGDRTSQLEGIAMDAQRIYYSTLDKRLAALPVKALLITMLLMCAYFVILMAPAAVQVKQVATSVAKSQAAKVRKK